MDVKFESIGVRRHEPRLGVCLAIVVVVIRVGHELSSLVVDGSLDGYTRSLTRL